MQHCSGVCYRKHSQSVFGVWRLSNRLIQQPQACPPVSSVRMNLKQSADRSRPHLQVIISNTSVWKTPEPTHSQLYSEHLQRAKQSVTRSLTHHFCSDSSSKTECAFYSLSKQINICCKLNVMHFQFQHNGFNTDDKSAYYYDFWRSCDTGDWSYDAENAEIN